MDETLTIWTARLAVGCWLARVLCQASRGAAAPGRGECLVWSAGCLLFLAHVACAFEFQHDWSHAAAYAHTEKRTAEVTGWSWGGGLYFNYLTALLWPLDAAVCWHWARARWVPPRAYRLAVGGFLAFMMVNATVVFGAPFWRWLAAAGIAGWFALHRRATRSE